MGIVDKTCQCQAQQGRIQHCNTSQHHIANRTGTGEPATEALVSANRLHPPPTLTPPSQPSEGHNGTWTPICGPTDCHVGGNRMHGWAQSTAACDDIHRSSWLFQAISFVYHSINRNGAAELSGKGGCGGGRGLPIVLPRAPPETGITLPAGPAKTPVGRDRGMMQACNTRPPAERCTEAIADPRPPTFANDSTHSIRRRLLLIPCHTYSFDPLNDEHISKPSAVPVASRHSPHVRSRLCSPRPSPVED
jgi:hypothetical protein